MASRVNMDYLLNVVDAQGIHLEQKSHFSFNPGTTPNGKREPVTLTASVFTALAPPAGAKGVAIILNGAVSLVLKGVTGDTGITLTPAANPITGFDLLLPLGATPSIGILNNSASNQVVECLWL